MAAHINESDEIIMSILQIDTSPRFDASNSRILSNHLVDQLGGDSLVRRDLAENPLPPLSAEDLVALHGGSDNGNASLRAHLAISDQLIAELKAADTLVIGMPVHNFSVPVVLKQWIDYVCRAGESFRYTATGPEGLTGIDSAWLIVAAGGVDIGGEIDFASTYMAHICKFIGVKTVHIIDASGSKRTPEEVIAKGKARIDALLGTKTTAETAA